MAILSLPDKHTNSNEIFERNKKSDASMICSNAKMVEEFSIELTVGDQWAENLSNEQAIMFAIDGKSIIIKPQSSIVVEVKESLKVPFNMYGLILQTGSVFLEQGVIIGAGKIEPSFEGNLKLLIYNTSKAKRTLKKGQKIASAIFIRTDRTINASIYNGSRTSVQKNMGLFKKAWSFFASDIKYTVGIIVTILSSSTIAAILSIYLSSSYPIDEIVEKLKPAQSVERSQSGSN